MELLRKIKPRNSQTDYVGLFMALAIIFGCAIFFVILYSTYDGHIKDKMNTALTSSTPVEANANVTKMLESTSSGLSKFNPLFPFLIIGIFGFVLVMALMAKSHPAFLFIGLVVLGVVLLLAAVYSNVFEAITDNPEYNNTADSFSVIAILLNNLPIIILLLFVVIAIILYVLPSGGGVGGVNI